MSTFLHHIPLALKMLMANANSSPVGPLRSHSCLPPLVPCSSWTLLTQHWPCCIVSPCSPWIDPAPSSSPGWEVFFPLHPTPTFFFSLCVFSVISTLCQPAICLFNGISWRIILVIIMPLSICHFVSPSFSLPPKLKVFTPLMILKWRTDFFFLCLFWPSSPRSKKTTANSFELYYNTHKSPYTSSPLSKNNHTTWMFLNKTSPYGAQQTFQGFTATFSLAAWKKCARKLHWCTDTAVSFWVWAKVLLNNNS